jgi:phosphatidylglycerol---prolipoprotein diacylglyceryl transferase
MGRRRPWQGVNAGPDDILGRAMYPYIHVGRFSIGTFGILLWLAAVVGCWILYKQVSRWGLAAAEGERPGRVGVDAVSVVAMATIAGVVGAKLWHVFEDPRELMAHPWALLFDRAGFAWFGGLLAGVAALCWQGRAAGLRALSMLDLATPAAAVGYGVGRIGCLTSGDGDYGKHTDLPWGVTFPHGLVPTTDHVHPTPVYELLVALAIGAVLWWRSAPRAGLVERRGLLTGEYLVLSGVARFLVEFIRINPPVWHGLTNAQLASLGSVVVGALLMVRAWMRGPEPLVREGVGVDSGDVAEVG